MGVYTCQVARYGDHVVSCTWILPDEVEAEIPEDGSVYFEFDAEVRFSAYTKPDRCYYNWMSKAGISQSYQIGVKGPCNLTITQGTSDWMKAPLDKKLEVIWGSDEYDREGSRAECGTVKSVNAKGRWKVKLSRTSFGYIKTHCLLTDSKGPYFVFWIENFSQFYMRIFYDDGRSETTGDKLCGGRYGPEDIFIKVYIPYAYKIESVRFSKNPANAGEEVDIYVTLTNLTGVPFDAKMTLSAVSRNARTKIFDKAVSLHVETGTKEYHIGSIKYPVEDELIFYFDAYTQSLFIQGTSDVPAELCYLTEGGIMKCETITAVRPGKIVVKGVRVEPDRIEVMTGRAKVYVTLANEGDVEASRTISVNLIFPDGRKQSGLLDTDVTLASGETKEILLGEIGSTQIGTHQVCADGQCATLEVYETPLQLLEENLVISPRKDRYQVGETVEIRYEVWFNKKVSSIKAFITVNGKEIASKTKPDSYDAVVYTTFTIPERGEYEICGDYEVVE